MLPVALRYPLRQDSAFFERARAYRSPFFTLLMAEESDDPQLTRSDSATTLPRFAIVVKKTVARGAERTQIKRILRSAIIEATSSPLPDFEHSYAVVVLPRRKALNTPISALAEELRKALTSLPA